MNKIISKTMRNWLVIFLIFLSSHSFGQFVYDNERIDELPICTTFEDLNKWEIYLTNNPSKKDALWIVFDLYYYQVIFDYIGINLETQNDVVKLVSYCDNYIRLFPDGINLEAIKKTKKSSEDVILEIDQRKATWEEQRRQQEFSFYYSINNSSTDQSVNESNIHQFVTKIEQYDQDGANTYYLVYFTNGKSYRIRNKSTEEYIFGDGSGWAYSRGGLGGWIHVGSKERALVNAYNSSNF